MAAIVSKGVVFRDASNVTMISSIGVGADDAGFLFEVMRSLYGILFSWVVAPARRFVTYTLSGRFTVSRRLALSSDLNSTATAVDEELAKSAEKAMERVLREMKEASGSDRRRAPRTPFFCPVTIELDGGRFAAFTRDLSPPGIGLLHRMPLDLGEITVHMTLPDGTLELRTLIVWCRHVGEGWYASGGRFLDPYDPSSSNG